MVTKTKRRLSVKAYLNRLRLFCDLLPNIAIADQHIQSSHRPASFLPSIRTQTGSRAKVTTTMAPTTRNKARTIEAYEVLELDPKKGLEAQKKFDKMVWTLNTTKQSGGIPPSDPRVLRLKEALRLVFKDTFRPLSAKRIRAIKKKDKQTEARLEQSRKLRIGELVMIKNKDGTEEVLTKEQAELRANWRPLADIGAVDREEFAVHGVACGPHGCTYF